MRESMLKGTSARIVMGGRLAKYQSLWPGVLEEGVLSLRAAQPLYLLGLFGGAARLLIDALRGIDRLELAGGGLSRLPDAHELRDEYRRRGQAVQTPEGLAAELKRSALAGWRRPQQRPLGRGKRRTYRLRRPATHRCLDP
jgi:hypothetical protein